MADLSVTVSDSPDPVPAGTNLTYTVVVTNDGPAPAEEVGLVVFHRLAHFFIEGSQGGNGVRNFDFWTLSRNLRLSSRVS